MVDYSKIAKMFPNSEFPRVMCDPGKLTLLIYAFLYHLEKGNHAERLSDKTYLSYMIFKLLYLAGTPDDEFPEDGSKRLIEYIDSCNLQKKIEASDNKEDDQ